MRLQRFNNFINEARDIVLYHGSPYEFSKFDLKKAGTGDGLNKYGYGLYFTDNEEAGRWYANELSIGAKRGTGFNLYSVRVTGLSNFRWWDRSMDLHEIEDICDRLRDKRKRKLADSIWEENDPDSGYDPYTLDDIYSSLSYGLGSKAKATAFLFSCGIYGAKVSDPKHGGTFYIAFSDTILRIEDVEKIG